MVERLQREPDVAHTSARERRSVEALTTARCERTTPTAAKGRHAFDAMTGAKSISAVGRRVLRSRKLVAPAPLLGNIQCVNNGRFGTTFAKARASLSEAKARLSVEAKPATKRNLEDSLGKAPLPPLNSCFAKLPSGKHHKGI